MTISRHVADLKSAILWQERLRQTLSGPSTGLVDNGLDKAAIDSLRIGAPSKVVWQVLDSSAAVTRIYALWEQAICDLVEEFVAETTRLHPSYATLIDVVRVNHRVGIGYILSKWASTNLHYAALSEESIAAGLVDGLRGHPYKLLSDAFLTDSENYRPDVVNRIFAKLGVANAFDRASQVPDAKSLIAKVLAGGDTAVSFLNRIVRERNEASHGDVNTVSGTGVLATYADFVEVLVFSLATLLRTQVVEAGRSTGVASEVAVAVKKYSGSIYGCRALAPFRLERGQTVTAGKSLFYEVVIEELRFGTCQVECVDAIAGTEFGMRLSREVPEGALLLITS